MTHTTYDKDVNEGIKPEGKGRKKRVFIITFIYIVIVTALFCGFFISLRGWGAVPLINKLLF